MSHSQWEKKKYKKAASEGKTSQLYAKLVKMITHEAKLSGGNRESSGLSAAIKKARSVDMPADNIERAIKKATEGGTAMESITYEAYGPGGVGIVIEALTDSKNRAAQEIRHILVDNGFALGGIGSVTWGFAKEITPEGVAWKPAMTIPISEEDSNALLDLVEQLEENNEVQEVFTNAE